MLGIIRKLRCWIKLHDWSVVPHGYIGSDIVPISCRFCGRTKMIDWKSETVE